MINGRMAQHAPVLEPLSVARIGRDELASCEAWRIAFVGQRKDRR